MDMNLHVVHDIETAHDFDETAPRSRTSPAPVERPVHATAWYHDAAIEEARVAAVEARCNPYASQRH